MARIAGVNIPNEKKVPYALTYIYGIGLKTAQEIVEKAKIDPEMRTKDLTEDQLQSIRDALTAYRVEGDLRREVMMNVKRLKEIHSYRGDRHARRLPVRGQRTKTNSRTMRGNVRRTMGSGRTALQKT